MRTLLGLGFHRVLTSGGAAKALGGADDIAAMVDAAEGILDICAGAGCARRTSPISSSAAASPYVHLSARRRSGSPVEDGAPDTSTDPAIIAAAVDAARRIVNAVKSPENPENPENPETRDPEGSGTEDRTTDDVEPESEVTSLYVRRRGSPRPSDSGSRSRSSCLLWRRCW